MTPRRFELDKASGDGSRGLENQAARGAAESDAVGADSGYFDAGLRAVIDAWASLPEAVRAGILAMVKAGTD